MSSGTSTAAQSVPCRRRPITSLWASTVPRRPWSHLGIDFVTDLPQLQQQQLCLGSSGSLLKGVQVHSRQGTAHGLRDSRMPISPRFQELWSSRGDYLGPGTPIYLPHVEDLLPAYVSHGDLVLRLPSSDKWPD